MIRHQIRETQAQTAADGWDERTVPKRWQPLLTVDEERELAGRIKHGDSDARGRLILANLRLVVAIIRKYKGAKLSFDDLIQEGNLGLIRASEDFDPSVHGCRFYLYAAIWIKAFIHRALIANDSMIRLPAHVYRRRERLRRSSDALAGAASGVEEVDSTSYADVGEVDSTSYADVDELDSEPGASGRRLGSRGQAESPREMPIPFVEAIEEMALEETIADAPPPDEEASDHEQRLLVEVALRRLNPVEAWVVRERFGLGPLCADELTWSLRPTRAELSTGREDVSEREAVRSRRRRSYFHRSYRELGQACGLSGRRIQQVERAALEKLRDVFQPGAA